MKLFLVHHGEAVGPDVDPRRPLSPLGQEAVLQLTVRLTEYGARPDVVWHSGKLRARQTAEACWRACNALATFSASRDLQPDDQPEWIRDRVRGESRDILVAGHFPHLGRLLALLTGEPAGRQGDLPPHGAVALETNDQGETWKEVWRIGSGLGTQGSDRT